MRARRFKDLVQWKKLSDHSLSVNDLTLTPQSRVPIIRFPWSIFIRQRQLLLSVLLLSLVLSGCLSQGDASNRPPSSGKKSQGVIETARLVYASNHSLLTALDGTSGAIVWTYHPGLSLNFISGISDATSKALYVGTSDGAHAHLVALRADTGQLIWSVAMEYAGIPLGEASNGLLYVGGAALSAFQPATGQQVWISRPDSGFFSTQPFLFNETIYVGGDDGLYAFDKATGKRQWKNSSITSVQSLTVSHHVLYTTPSPNPANSNNILALDAGTGKILWQFRASGKIQGDLQAANGLIYFSTADNFVNAMREGSPALVWRIPLAFPGTPGVITGSNITITGKWNTYYTVYGLAWESGKILWRSDFSTWKLSSYRPRIAGLVYTARNGVHDASDGYVVALVPGTGKILWQTQVDGGDDGDMSPITAWCLSAALHCDQANQKYT